VDKCKPHLMLHLPDHVRRFGPPVLYSTEVFESYNGAFRKSSILSNHQSPSHDICNAFAQYGRIRHLVQGGYWHDK
ncbi:hypothetical protein CALCODRAFT_417771, partial [Calocera cornea HHB12733]